MRRWRALGRLGEGLVRLGAVSARAEHGVGGDETEGEATLGGAEQLVGESEHGAVELHDARGGGVGEILELRAGGDVARGGAVIDALRIFRARAA